jgi:hypothetical protein
VQANGRCETANSAGDTYGPVTYHAYLPGLWLFGWDGEWDSLPAARFTSILFDLLTLLGLAATGYRYGGRRLGVTLAFAWAAFPFTQYTASANSNDAIMAALLVWGFWAATYPTGRGTFVGLASWSKLGALILLPLWLTYPDRKARSSIRFTLAFVLVTLASFWFVFRSDGPIHEVRLFYERTFQVQAERSSPFSLWDWGGYGAAGLPDLGRFQRMLQVGVVVVAMVVALVPRRKSPLQLAAYSAVLLMALQLALTHWIGTYVVWFLPFVLLSMLAGSELLEGVRTSAKVPGTPRRRGIGGEASDAL